MVMWFFDLLLVVVFIGIIAGFAMLPGTGTRVLVGLAIMVLWSIAIVSPIVALWILLTLGVIGAFLGCSSSYRLR
jgi:hypothetical protein